MFCPRSSHSLVSLRNSSHSSGVIAKTFLLSSSCSSGGDAEFCKDPASRPRQFATGANRRFKFKKRCQLLFAMSDKALPLSRCASTIQIVRPSESMAEMQPQLQPDALRLSAMISQYFINAESNPQRI